MYGMKLVTVSGTRTFER